MSRVELPAAVTRMVAPPPENAARTALPTVRKSRSGPPVIFVVEDNPDFDNIKELMGEEGYAEIVEHVQATLSGIPTPVFVEPVTQGGAIAYPGLVYGTPSG